MINASRVLANGLSHNVESYDLTRFTPAVQKSLVRFHLLREGISIEPIIRKIVGWDSPLEQLFYVTFIYLRTSRRIDANIRIEEQHHVVSNGKQYQVIFRLSLADELHPDLPPLFIFVECDGRMYHDRTPHEFEAGRERLRELQRQGGKAYPFAASQLLKKPMQCVIECVQDLQRDLLSRREMLMKPF